MRARTTLLACFTIIQLFNFRLANGQTFSRVTDAANPVASDTEERVRMLAQGAYAKGNHSIEWNGKNDSGNEPALGIYYYSLQGGATLVTRKMVLLR